VRKKKSSEENPLEQHVAVVGVRELRTRLRDITIADHPTLVKNRGGNLCVILPLGGTSWEHRYDSDFQCREFDRHAAAARKKLGGDSD
jgi:hypothetical protein